MNLVKALNEISLNIWALVIISLGVTLAIKGRAEGATLVTGGFALLRGPSIRPPTA